MAFEAGSGGGWGVRQASPAAKQSLQKAPLQHVLELSTLSAIRSDFSAEKTPGMCKTSQTHDSGAFLSTNNFIIVLY